MTIWLLTRKRSARSKMKPEPREAPATPTETLGSIAQDWQRVLMASLDQNSVAPSDDVILHAFDLFCDELYAPFFERRRLMAELHAEISAEIAALQALEPGLIERAIARHPFEFSHIIEHKETRR